MSDTRYQFLRHIDAPKRVMTLTMDELVVAGIGMFLLVVSSQKILVALFSLGLFSVLKFIKRGEGPRQLLVLAYWYLPHEITKFFLPKLPASHLRLWVA